MHTKHWSFYVKKNHPTIIVCFFFELINFHNVFACACACVRVRACVSACLNSEGSGVMMFRTPELSPLATANINGSFSPLIDSS